MKLAKSASNSRHLKVLNRLLVLNTIRKRGPIARYEVAKVTGLTPPTVTVIVNDLIKAGVIKEIGSGESSGGRKPVLLELEPRSGFIFAVRLQHGEIVAALIDMDSNILESRSFKLDTSLLEGVVNAIKESFDLLVEHTGISKNKVLWCGVATPGLIDFNSGTVERSSNLGWKKTPFCQVLSENLAGIPVHIENISNAAALGEKVYGSARGTANLIYLNLSVGIGAGIIIDNGIYNGVQGYAGEVGLMILSSESGPGYLNGKYSNLEAICGERAVLERIKSEVPDEMFNLLGVSKMRLSINDLMNPLFLEAPEVKEVLCDTGRIIGIAVANLVSLFNIPLVILGGELARFGEIISDTVIKKVKDCIPPEMGESVQIICSNMQEDPPLMGVYALVLEKTFATKDWLLKDSMQSIPDANQTIIG